MSFMGRSRRNNTILGIIFLMLMMVFVGPNRLPSLLSDRFEFIDEGIPCQRLRVAQDRAYHQSLIGRQTRNPLDLTVRSSAIPSTQDGFLSIRLTITNNTIGTVPIVYNPNQVIVGDNNSSGLGIIFTPPANVTNGAVRNPGALLPTDIRILGPRQRCVHRIDFPAASLDPTILSGGASVQAYYRINTAGTVTQTNPLRLPIFPDQGLAIVEGGIIVSEPVSISLTAQAN